MMSLLTLPTDCKLMIIYAIKGGAGSGTKSATYSDTIRSAVNSDCRLFLVLLALCKDMHRFAINNLSRITPHFTTSTRSTGMLVYELCGRYHRDGDLPAIDMNGAQKWYQFGKHHRNNGPATIYPMGLTEWRQHGQLHRGDDKPALISTYTQIWYRRGLLHRDPIYDANGNFLYDQPAVMYASGGREWWQNGKLHRGGDLPAIVRANGSQEWYDNGIMYKRTPL